MFAEDTWRDKEKGECVSITSIKIILSKDCVKTLWFAHTSWSLEWSGSDTTPCIFGQGNMLMKLHESNMLKIVVQWHDSLAKIYGRGGDQFFSHYILWKASWVILKSSRHHKFMVASVSFSHILHPETLLTTESTTRYHARRVKVFSGSCLDTSWIKLEPMDWCFDTRRSEVGTRARTIVQLTHNRLANLGFGAFLRAKVASKINVWAEKLCA